MAKLLYYLAIFGSLISQTPALLDTGVGSMLKMLWILPLLYMALLSPKGYLRNQMMPYYLFLFLFSYYCFSCWLFTGKPYFTEDIYYMAISFMVLMVSFNFWLNNNDTIIIQRIALIMLVCGTFLSINVYTNFLQGTNVLAPSYAYDEKNSISTIQLCCAFVVLFLYKPKNRTMHIASVALSFLILFIMVILRSRATLISAAYMLFYFLSKKRSKRVNIALVATGFLLLVFLLTNSAIQQIIIQGIVLGGRNADDADAVSSGRLTLYTIAIDNVIKYPWFGSGDYYVDCMPLNFQVQYGVFGLIGNLGFIYYVYRTIKKCKRGILRETTKILFWTFILNAAFEARPPYGPGTKCFFLWMFLGFLLAEQVRNASNETEQQETADDRRTTDDSCAHVDKRL